MEPGRRATALALSILAPGLGHVYVRSWGRALGWCLGGVAVLLAVAPDAVWAVVAARSVAGAALAARSLPVESLLAVVLGVRVLGTVDVWWLLRRRAERDGVARCDSCARRRDPAVEFCPWCLAEFGRQ